MNFYLMRHGKTRLNGNGILLGSSDPDLADVRDPKIIEWKESLSNIPFVHLIHSGMKRTEQSLAILKEAYPNIPVTSDKRIQEIDFGGWELKSYDWLYQNERVHFNKWVADPFIYAPPNGETLTALTKRVVAFLNEWSQKEVAGPILVVTHGGVLRLLWATIHQTGFYEKEVKPAEMYQLNWKQKTMIELGNNN